MVGALVFPLLEGGIEPGPFREDLQVRRMLIMLGFLALMILNTTG
jgi:hypothetical protein